jgi:uncharacterized damage-inducible protein DinB
MAINEMLLPEFDQEMAKTRTSLERVPDDKFDWKPHTKSMSVRQLAVHLATIPGWGAEVFDKTSLDVAPVGAPPYKPPDVNSRKDLLDVFDSSVSKARQALQSAGDPLFMEKWTLLAGGKTIFSMPRIAVFRGMIMNHMIHHRAQLGVYLRLNDLPVPAIYGPSADEGNF